MNRFGVTGLDAAMRIARACKKSGLSITGLFTHFPLAEEEDLSGHRAHVGGFAAIYEALSEICEFRYVHCENSAAVLIRDERLGFCNFVRPGVILYGYSSRGPVDWLLPSIYVSSQVVDIIEAPEGGSLGYGAGFAVRRRTRVAVLPIGYGDGLTRARKAAPVFINGEPRRILNEIFMSHTFVEADEKVRIGDEAEIYGDNVRIDTLSSMGVVTNTEQMSALHVASMSRD
jgi:alanine racemase